MAEFLASVPAWAFDAGYVVVWLAVALVIVALLSRGLTRLAGAKPTAFHEVLAASLPRPAGAAVFLLAMSAGLRWLPVSESMAVPLRRAFPILFGLLAIAVLMRVAFRSIDAYGRSFPQLKSSSGIGRAAIWVIGLAGIALFVCDALGITLAPALTALGLGSLAFALALQETLSNFFAGLYLLADKPISPGDFIRIDVSHEGFVEAIGWRSTQLRTLSNNLVIVPNATLSKAIITNFSRPTPKAAIDIRLDVAAESDVDAVETVLADEATRALDIPGVMADPAPVVRFSPGFVDGALAFTVSCQVDSYAAQGTVQHELRKRIARRLRKENIALAAPPLAKR